MKTQHIHIVRVEELLDMIDALEDETSNLDPIQDVKYVEGVVSGLNIIRKIVALIQIETIEYDRLDVNAEA